MSEIKVLDHGHVRLVESMGSDLSIVRNARVSYDAEWRTGEDEGKDAKLIDYLVKNHHTSPLEVVQFTFDVKATTRNRTHDQMHIPASGGLGGTGVLH